MQKEGAKEMNIIKQSASPILEKDFYKKIERCGRICYKSEDTITYGTGLAFCPPAGVEMQARPRSSIRDTGLVLPNSPGTLDSNFRGEVTATFYKVIKSRKPYKVGDRIFQIVINEAIAKPWDIQFVEAETLSDSERGTGGYGSTGK